MKVIRFVTILFIILPFLISIFAYSYLPDRMVSHWNAKGNPDDTLTKFWGAFLLPIVSLSLFFLFVFLIRIDPLKKNIQKFMGYYEGFILILILFLFYLYSLMTLWNLGYKFNMNIMMLVSLSALMGYIGFFLPKLKRNWFIGIRTPWTLSNDKVWHKTHLLGGYLFEVCAIIIFIGIFFETYAFYFIILPILLTAIILMVYSYIVFKKIKK
ncbi:MAG: SdpI family protein [Candidatus Pacearchaeota archaeon]